MPRNEVNYVTNRVFRFIRIALRQQIRVFMLVTQMTRGRSVTLRKYQMSNDVEPCGAESVHKAVCLRPSIEADAKAITGKHAVHFGKGPSQTALSSFLMLCPARSWLLHLFRNLFRLCICYQTISKQSLEFQFERVYGATREKASQMKTLLIEL